MSSNFSEQVNFIWSVADLIRDTFKRGKYQDVILPFSVLRRIDSVLEPTKDEVVETYYQYKDRLENLDGQLRQRSGYASQFSYVMHDRDTNERDPAGNEQEAQQMLHAHVITPGTHIGDYGHRESQPKFIRAERLHELTRDVFERRLERSLGRDRFRQLMRERERELQPEQERQLPARSGPDLELGR